MILTSWLRELVEGLIGPPADEPSSISDLLPGLLTLLACLASYWYYYIYKPSLLRRVKEETASTVGESEFDAVVIGGGPGGFGALSTLAEGLRSRQGKKSWRIALVEEGQFAVGDMVEAPQFRHDIVGSVADRGTTISAPFDNSDCATSSPPAAHRWLRRYPRGLGLGGTTLVDWHISIFDKKEDKAILAACGIPPAQLSVQRNPLSWAFAEACKAAGFTPVLPDGETSSVSAPCAKKGHQLGTVFPLVLDVTDKGHNRSMFRSLPGPRSSAQSDKASAVEVVYVRAKALLLESKESSTGASSVTSVVIESTSAAKSAKKYDLPKKATARLHLSKSGVVLLCAGVFGSRSLLRGSAHSLQGPASMHQKIHRPLVFGDDFFDAIGVPLLYEARPGISDDAVNNRTIRNLLAWYGIGKGPLAAPISDTAAHVDAAGVTIMFESSGGFTKQQFASRGLHASLGVFKEAFTFWVVLSKLDVHRNRQSGSTLNDDAAKVDGLDGSDDKSLVKVIMPKDVASSAVDALAAGLRTARTVAQTEPLRSLTTGREAIDTTLFPEDGAALCRMLYAPKNKQSRNGFHAAKDSELSPQAAERLRVIAEATIASEQYLAEYVTKHARYMGYGCGTVSRSPLAATNCFVGDTSVAVPGKSSLCPLLLAGSTASAVANGRLAALEAIKLLPSS